MLIVFDLKFFFISFCRFLLTFFLSFQFRSFGVLFLLFLYLVFCFCCCSCCFFFLLFFFLFWIVKIVDENYLYLWTHVIMRKLRPVTLQTYIYSNTTTAITTTKKKLLNNTKYVKRQNNKYKKKNITTNNCHKRAVAPTTVLAIR